jgi:hypothetical protein
MGAACRAVLTSHILPATAQRQVLPRILEQPVPSRFCGAQTHYFLASLPWLLFRKNVDLQSRADIGTIQGTQAQRKGPTVSGPRGAP